MDRCLLLLALAGTFGCANSQSTTPAHDGQAFHSHWADGVPETLEFSGYRATRPHERHRDMKLSVTGPEGRMLVSTTGELKGGTATISGGHDAPFRGTITHPGGRQSVFQFDTISGRGTITIPEEDPVAIVFSVMDPATAIPGDRTAASFTHQGQMVGRVAFGPTTSVSVENVSPEVRSAVAGAAAAFFYEASK